MAKIDFADIVHQPVSFDSALPSDRLILNLIDTAWVQRLRDISQTANTRLVYMFSEHSRFGHSLGVAYLASVLLGKLSEQFPEQVGKFRLAVSAAALLHDIGHIAPGSHTAVKTWFPDAPDRHEALGASILKTDEEIYSVLESFQTGLVGQVQGILNEEETVPPWTWQIISGGSWNVDRGNWCVVDSILAGVSYGRYNVGALLDSFFINSKQELSLRENRLDAMMHFAISRHAMYQQVYQHRVILAADTLNRALVQRARKVKDRLPFLDETMAQVLNAKEANELPLTTIFEMRESWWRYHLSRWSSADDAIVSDLSRRLINRQLFKTIRISSDDHDMVKRSEEAVRRCGFDPEYYLHRVSTTDMLASEYHQPMPVGMEDGSSIPVTEADTLMSALGKAPSQNLRHWLVMPSEAKLLLNPKVRS